jgi:hypothetical protein
MIKGKHFYTLILVVIVFGIIISCQNGTNPDNFLHTEHTEQKEIVIKNLPNVYTNKIGCVLISNIDPTINLAPIIALGAEYIDDTGLLNVSLETSPGKPWNGNGEYYIGLEIVVGNCVRRYILKNGSVVTKYNISSKISEMLFADFEYFGTTNLE